MGMAGHLVIRLFYLLRLPLAQAPDGQADDEECARRQQQQAVQDVPATRIHGRQQGYAEQGTGTQQFAEERHEQQHHRVAQAVTDTVHKAQPGAVLHGEAFSAAHYDTVGDDQANEYRQLFADFIGVGFQDLVDHDYQGGNDGHLNDDPDAARNLRTNQGNRQVGESSNGDNRQTHDDGHVHAGGYRRSEERRVGKECRARWSLEMATA